MNVSKFLVLGSLEILGEGSGYDILIELEKKKVTKWINIKKGSIYFALNKLSKENYILEKGVARTGLYPLKTTYQIADSGKALFDRYQEEAFLGLFPYYYGFKMALKFNSRRTHEELIEFAKKAISRIDSIIDQMDKFLASSESNKKDIIFIEHDKILFEAEKNWIKKVSSLK